MSHHLGYKLTYDVFYSFREEKSKILVSLRVYFQIFNFSSELSNLVFFYHLVDSEKIYIETNFMHQTSNSRN